MEITITIKIGDKSIELTMAEAIELHAALAGMFVKTAPSPSIPTYNIPVGPIKRDAPWDVKYKDSSAAASNLHHGGMITSKAVNGGD